MDQGCLSRDDFEGAPISLDEIEPNLWLGNVSAAKNVDTLVDYGITDVLTVDAVALPDTVRQLRWLTNKYVKLNDVAKEDILSRLEECIAFISAALGGRRKVLVHCYFGVSRSAAIVIGYIMHKYQLTYEQAFQHVKAKRPAISPNAGFVQQLTLFFEMHWCIDSRHQIYKSFQLRMAAMEIQKLTAGPANFKHLIREDPAVATYSPELELNTRPALNYRCRKCRRTLATDAQHIQHVAHSTAANQSSAYDEHNGLLADILVANGGARVTNGLICTDSIFIEPIAWMADVAQQRQGKLHCPKCETKVGSFNWVSGSICPCGTVVAPAFYLVPSKVELSRRLIGGRYKV